jgi:hypothetical protein
MTVQLISDLGLHLNLKFDSDEFVENDEISSSRKSLFWAVQSSHTYDEHLTPTLSPLISRNPILYSLVPNIASLQIEIMMWLVQGLTNF